MTMTTVMVFDLEVAGHHPGYLRHLLRYWPGANTQLLFVVAPGFAQLHRDVVQMETCAQITWQPITQEEYRWYQASKRVLAQRAWVEWRLYCRYAKKLQADQGLIMYIDRFQLPLALRFSLPCKTSGIYFRPKFHYNQFSGHQPTAGEWLRAQRERMLWRSALRQPQLQTLFCLDPTAVEPLRRLGGTMRVTALPDPVEICSRATTSVVARRQTIGIDPARKVLLLFGMLDRRKGIFQVLEALQQLAPAHQAQLTLLFVGPLVESDRAAVTAQIETLRRTSPLQIVVHDRFIADEEIQPYFALADVVLALYQQHVGMSAILVRAAAASKPVLATDYGVMGEMVRRHKLGQTVSSPQPAEIAAAILRFLEQESVLGFDVQSAATYAHANSAANFATLLAVRMNRTLRIGDNS